MQQKNMTPNVITLNAAINGYERGKHLKKKNATEQPDTQCHQLEYRHH